MTPTTPPAARDPAGGSARPDPASDSADSDPTSNPRGDRGQAKARAVRKAVPLRLDPAVHAAMARWASDELRSLNAQIELTLRRALADAGRLPTDAAPIRRPGRPPRTSGASNGNEDASSR